MILYEIILYLLGLAFIIFAIFLSKGNIHIITSYRYEELDEESKKECAKEIGAAVMIPCSMFPLISAVLVSINSNLVFYSTSILIVGLIIMIILFIKIINKYSKK